jgi:hypothetical protein
MHHRSTSKRDKRAIHLLVEQLDSRVMLSGNTVFHTGHSHTVLRNAAIAAAAAVGSGTTASPDVATASSSATASPAATTLTYNRTAAVAYATQYWNKVVGDGYFWINGSTTSYYGAGAAVPMYVTNEAGGIGDDCAHFVSSCIGAPPGGGGGGLTIPSRAGTYGEPGAARLDELLVGNSGGGYGTTYQYGQLVSSVSQLTPGDVIGYDWDGSGKGSMSGIDHTAIYIGNGLVDCHAESQQSANWTLGGADDYFFIHITLPDAIAPTAPTNGTPASNATNVSVTPKLTASAFSDGAAGGTQTAAEWQVLNGTTVVYDSGTDTTDLKSITIPSGKLTNGTTYTWKVRVEDNYGDWSSYSTATAFTAGIPATDMPPTLSSLSVSAASIVQSGTETLNPMGVSDPDGTVASVSYYLESNGVSGLQTGTGGDTLLATLTARPYTTTINTLSQATGTYTVYAQAVDNLGATSPVQSATYTVTPAFSSIVAQATTDSNVTITWSTPPAGLPNIDVDRSMNGGPFIQIAVLDGTVTSYTDSGLTPDTQYAYQISPASGRSTGTDVTAAAIDTLLPGDADGNGTVGPNDLAIVLANFGTTAGATWASGDFDGNGKVDGNDLALVLGSFGQSTTLPTIS